MAYRTTPRMARRKEARRRKLLDSAIRLFGTHGYHATTVPMIVEQAGSSTGSFYFYFRNKEDVFAAALQDIGDRLAAALNTAIAAESEPLAQMKAAVRGLFSFLAGNPLEARILVTESSGLGGRLEEIRRGILASHARGVEAALSRLSLSSPPLNLPLAARCWVGAVFEAVSYWLGLPPDQRPPVQTAAAAVGQFNLRAIGAPPDLA